MRMSVRYLGIPLFVLVLGGAHEAATASCDITGSNALMAGQSIPARERTQDSATQRPTQGRSETSPAKSADTAKPATPQRN